MNYSISIILPILNEINSLKKTLLIINKIKVDKEFIVIYSEKLTKNSVKDEIKSLKKKNTKISDVLNRLNLLLVEQLILVL